MNSNKEIEELKNNYFLFTYKSKMPYKNLQSDSGWGCMARSSQMLISKILLDYEIKEKKIVLDLMLNELNFKNMIEYSNTEFNYKIGTFMKFTTCLLSYKHLFEKNKINIKLIVWVDNYINLFKLYEGVYDKIFPEKIISLENFKDFPNKKYILNVSVILGVDYPNKEYKKQFYNLIENKYFIGIWGGKGNSGYYYYKKDKDDFYYLDPHKTIEYSKNLTDYLPNDIKKLKYEELNPCTMISFKIFSYEELYELFQIIEGSQDILFVMREDVSINSDDIICFD